MFEVRGLCKTFKRRRSWSKRRRRVETEGTGRYIDALIDVGFSVEPGSILGLLGPNGAGKTTLLRILATSLRPTRGTACVDGIDICENPMEVRKRIGLLSDSTGLYGRLTAREMLEYFGRLHGISGRPLRSRIDELTHLLDMQSFIDRRNDLLSAGMKQKVSIARTLVHDPQTIMFDEPTTGLDVAAAEAILTFIESCKQRQKTVLFCTHHMHEVERLCEKVVVLNRARVCFTGTLRQLRKQTGFEPLDKAFLALVGSQEVPRA